MVTADDGRALLFVRRSSVRLNLLTRLSRERHTPSELARLDGKHVSHVSRALRELRRAGLVECVRTGSRERFYRTTGWGIALLQLLHVTT